MFDALEGRKVLSITPIGFLCSSGYAAAVECEDGKVRFILASDRLYMSVVTDEKTAKEVTRAAYDASVCGSLKYADYLIKCALFGDIRYSMSYIDWKLNFERDALWKKSRCLLTRLRKRLWNGETNCLLRRFIALLGNSKNRAFRCVL